MKKIIILTIVILSCNLSLSQVTQEWVKTFPGTGVYQGNGNSIVVDNSGFIFVTGSSIKTDNGPGYDMITIKYGSDGQEQWVKRFDDKLFSLGKSMCTDAEGNVYVTGSCGVDYNPDFCTIKYNSQGVQQWVHTYNGPGNDNDQALSIAVDGSGNVFVAGYSKGLLTGLDYATLKYNSRGGLEWVRRYSATSTMDDVPAKLVVDNAGNVYVTGKSVLNATAWEYTTIKYDLLGTVLWIKKYNGPGPGGANFATSLAVDASGNVYVTGGSSETLWDYATIKYNSAGTQQWVQRYTSPGNRFDHATALILDDSGNVYVTGESFTSFGNSAYVTIKYNTMGIQQWIQSFSGWGNGRDQPSSIAIDNSANVYVTGWSRGIGTRKDYQTIKYSSQGVTQWSKRYNGSGPGLGGDDYALGVAVDGSGNVYVSGSSQVTSIQYNFATIKYSQGLGLAITGNKESNNEVPSEFKLYDNFPNPFNPVTKIRFDIPQRNSDALSFVKLVIFDVLGNEVTTLTEEALKPGKYEVDWNASQSSSGVYFYKLITSSFIETKKMILVK